MELLSQLDSTIQTPRQVLGPNLLRGKLAPRTLRLLIHAGFKSRLGDDFAIRSNEVPTLVRLYFRTTRQLSGLLLSCLLLSRLLSLRLLLSSLSAILV
jgi:hypothetical protein